MYLRTFLLMAILISLSKRSFAKRNLRAKMWIPIAPFYKEDFRKREEADKRAYSIEWHRINDQRIQEEKEKADEQNKKLEIQEMNRREQKEKLRDRQALVEQTEKTRAEQAVKNKAKKESNTKKTQEEAEKHKKAQEEADKIAQEEAEKRKKAQEEADKKAQEEEEKTKKAQEEADKKAQEEEEKTKMRIEQAKKAVMKAKEQDEKKAQEQEEKEKKAAERRAAIEAKKRRDLFGIMVISRRDDFKRRNAIRQTWGNYSKDIPVYFMVGTHCPYKPWHRKPNSCTPISDDIVVSKRYVLEQEARTARLQQEENVVVLDAIHVDDQNAKMLYLGYQWMYKHAPKRYTLKTDESYNVDVEHMYSYLYNHTKDAGYREIFTESYDPENIKDGDHMIFSSYLLKRLFKGKQTSFEDNGDSIAFLNTMVGKIRMIRILPLDKIYFTKV